MAEKIALPQVDYVSDNPEQGWEQFQGAMRHILKVPKEKIGSLHLGIQCEDSDHSEKKFIPILDGEREMS